nr:LuxR C-terminal-related transcriptional regulator [Streptomyces sp. NBC_00899]
MTATLNRIRKKVGGSAQHTLLDRAYRTGQLPAPTPTAPPPGTELSAEQRRILQLQAGGATAEQIAAALVVSDSTASNRIRAIHTALGAHSAAEAVRRGWELGYLHREEPPATAGTA